MGELVTSRLTLYSRPGCHLCDEMKEVVMRVAARVPVVLEEVNIAEDPQLEALYGQEIPILFVEGRKVAKYRIDEIGLLRSLRDR